MRKKAAFLFTFVCSAHNFFSYCIAACRLINVAVRVESRTAGLVRVAPAAVCCAVQRTFWVCELPLKDEACQVAGRSQELLEK
jgi:hypothetical protein